MIKYGVSKEDLQLVKIANPKQIIDEENEKLQELINNKYLKGATNERCNKPSEKQKSMGNDLRDHN